MSDAGGAIAAANPRSGRILSRLAVVVSLLWIGLAIAIPFLRLWYPFEVEWMGGAFADHVARVLDGKPIYVEPSPDFVPYLYTPLYMYLSAGMSLLVGEGMQALRLVSILASLVNVALLFALVRGRTRSTVAAAVACATWSGCYFLVESWYDAERVDSTFLAFVIGAVLTLDRGRSHRARILAGLLMVAAYMTKQTALLLVPPLWLFATVAHARSWRDWLRHADFLVAFALPWFALTAWMDHVTDGWFSFYTWRLPREHQYVLAPFWKFWLIDSHTMWPAICASAWYFLRGPLLAGARATFADAALCLGLLGAGLASRMHVGGAVNVLMPTWFGFALFTGFAWQRTTLLPREPERVLVRLLILLQLIGFAFKFRNSDQPREAGLLDVGEYLPTEADARAGHRLVELLRKADGDVLVPFHGFLPRMAGKRGGAHAMALIDIRGEGLADMQKRLMDGFWSSARDRRADLVVLDENLEGMGQLIWPGYVSEGRLVRVADFHTFMPVVGLKTRPIMLFRRAK
ncbi:MAG: glycosyltransferase family 39 protein [Planctomycetota bacterium]